MHPIHSISGRRPGNDLLSAEPAVDEAVPPRAFRRVVRNAGLPDIPADDRVVTDSDLAGLPEAAQRYLRFMAVVDRPRDWSVRAHLMGRFRRRADRPWMPCEAWQYTSAVPPARMFRMRILFGGRVPMLGWDTYLHGRGRMRGKLLGLVPVADGSGPHFDTSELVTWLNDAVLLAPSMLLGPAITWSPGPDADSFIVAVTDEGRTVSARVMLDHRGVPREFRTDDRYADLPGGLVRARWRTPMEGWAMADGCPRMTRAGAVVNDGRKLTRSRPLKIDPLFGWLIF
jgi:hypothetical protein